VCLAECDGPNTSAGAVVAAVYGVDAGEIAKLLGKA
jgi:hypothetical protein